MYHIRSILPTVITAKYGVLQGLNIPTIILCGIQYGVGDFRKNSHAGNTHFTPNPKPQTLRARILEPYTAKQSYAITING